MDKKSINPIDDNLKYKNKYLKYKNKYTLLKESVFKQTGGQIWFFNTTRDKNYEMNRLFPGTWRQQSANTSSQYAEYWWHNTVPNLHCGRYKNSDSWHCSNNPPATPIKQEQNASINSAPSGKVKWDDFNAKDQKHKRKF